MALRLAKHIEWMTGFPISQPLVGDMRHIPTLKKTLRNMCHDDHNNRGANTLLPVDFDLDGVYEKITGPQPGRVAVRNRYTRIEHEVKLGYYPKDSSGAPIPHDEWYVESNFSTQNATLTAARCGCPVPVIQLGDFAAKRQPALEDKVTTTLPRATAIGSAASTDATATRPLRRQWGKQPCPLK